MVEQLGRLSRHNPRDVWSNEATGFTPWLQEHIELLAEAVGVDIQSVDREVAVGDFSVDLVGEEPGSSRPVVIENQLERTNHDHLGKLLTYAAGKNGGVIIWVAPQIRPEHQNALEWLNGATQGNIDFFGVELELLQIDGSGPKAPNFKVVVAPKGFATPLAHTQNTQTTERAKLYQVFFQDLLERLKGKEPRFTNRSRAGARSWITFPSGKSGFGYNLAFASGARFRVEVYIDLGDREQNKFAFDGLLADKDSIEEQLGTALEWKRLDNRRASRIAWYWDSSITIMDETAKLEQVKGWAVQHYFDFRRAFHPYLESLDIAYEEGLLGELDAEP